MISALSGELRRVEEDRVHLAVGPMLYELLVPAADIAELHATIGQTITFHTILYLEGDPNRGNLEPRLIGFLRADDRRFFHLFTTVKGIGVKTALRALTVPAGQIAHAIETRDTRFLAGLSGIGKRTAELIVAQLAGKMEPFTAGYTAAGAAAPVTRRETFEEDAIQALMALGERRPDAERLLDRVRQAQPNVKATDALLREMLRLRTVRA